MASNDEYRAQLASLQRIRSIAGSSDDLDLPQICVVGDQSSGKSALLAEITRIQFPVNAGICTKAPMVVECKCDDTLSDDVFEIMESGHYQQVDQPESLASKISELQTRNLVHEETKISMTEIRIRVCGPTQVDLIVIDLPGIINQGKGESETKQLINKYIEKEQTLILLVSEAKQDDELCTAIGMIKQVDPDGARTLRIYTKCDNFDSNEAKVRMSQRVCSSIQASPKLHPHAVICRLNGGQTYDDHEEKCCLEPLDLPEEAAGMASLKARLPPLFAELIQNNIPKLERVVMEVIQSTRVGLRDVGEEPLSHDAMLRQCQMVLKDCSIRQLQEPISAHLELFRGEIMATHDRVTKDWSDEKFKPSVFECPFFQGSEALRACMQDITSWWHPILEKYRVRVEHVARAHVKEVLASEAHGVPVSLQSAIVSEWELECNSVFGHLKEVFENRLRKEVPFGTVNHYLTTKFNEAETLPDQLVEDCTILMRAKWAEREDMLKRQKQQAEDAFAKVSALSNSQAESKRNVDAVLQAEVALKNACRNVNVEMALDMVRVSLVEAKSRWVNAFDNSSLHVQQQHRLYHAVKAVWAVEHKTFVDYILKETNEHLLQPRDFWVLSGMHRNEVISQAAVEDPATEAKRQNLKDTLERMKQCIEEIKGLKSQQASGVYASRRSKL